MLSYFNLGVKHKYDLILLSLEVRFLYNVHRHNFLKSDVSLKNPLLAICLYDINKYMGKNKSFVN